jgi:hypothetical protein
VLQFLSHLGGPVRQRKMLAATKEYWVKRRKKTGRCSSSHLDFMRTALGLCELHRVERINRDVENQEESDVSRGEDEISPGRGSLKAPAGF